MSDIFWGASQTRPVGRSLVSERSKSPRGPYGSGNLSDLGLTGLCLTFILTQFSKACPTGGRVIRVTMSNARWRLQTTSLFALLTIVLAGCQGNNTSGAQATKLIVLSDGVATGFNTDGASGLTQYGQVGFGNLMDTVLTFPGSEKDGVLVPDYSQFQPALATSWTQNGLTWTFKLRPNVKSCAGNMLTADDIVYTFARGKSLAGGATGLVWFLGNVSGLFTTAPVQPNATAADKQLNGEVKKIDDLTVQFTQVSANSLFPRILANLYLSVFDSKEMMKHATASDPWSKDYVDTTGAAGFGPYCLSQWTSGQSLTITANPGYYKKAQFTKVVINAVPSDANRVAALRSGQADIVEALTPAEYRDLAGQSNTAVLQWSSNQLMTLLMNYNFAPWNLPNNKLIRQAVNYAIPYDNIIKTVYFGAAKRFYSMGIAPGYAGEVDIQTYDTNLDKARSLLAQAGYPNGKGLEKYTNGLQLTYAVERKAILEPIALQVQTSLAQIGIPITLNPVTDAEIRTKFPKQQVPFALDDFEKAVVADTLYAIQLFFVTNGKGAVYNIMNYSNPKIDSDWAAAQGLPDGADRTAKLTDAQQILMDDAPWAPICLFNTEVAVRKGITGLWGNPSDVMGFWTFHSS